MTNPDDPNRWGQAQPPGTPQHPYNAPPPQEPVTGSVVSYNASAFDDDDDPAGESSQSSVPPTAQGQQHRYDAPASGSFAAPSTGSYDAPASGSFAAPSTGSYDAPASGSFAAPSTGSYEALPSGYQAAPSTGYTPVPPYGDAAGGYGAPPVAGPPSGGYPAQPGPGATEPAKARSNKPLLLGLGALVLVGLLIAGYFVFFTFGGIKNAQGDISNAQAFLGEAESTWKDELPSDGIEVSSKAACYYVLDDSDDITNQIACGPSRRASTPKGAVWDMYHYDVTGSGDSQSATNLAASDTSQPAPTSGSLVTVDGDEPADDGSGLKEPPLPKAPSHAVYEQGSYEINDKSLGASTKYTDAALLVGPGAQVTLVSKQEATSATIDGKLMAPAEGEKFVVISVNGEPGPVQQSASNSLLFTIDGDAIEAASDPSGLGETAYLISWPDDTDASLDLVSAGHPQTLNLDGGARTDDKTASMYYTDKPEISTPQSAVATFPATASSAGDSFTFTVTFTNAKLKPYTSDQGWAPEGKVWLILDFTDTGEPTAPTKYTTYFLDCMTSSVDGGSMHTCPAPGAGNKGVLIASVPSNQSAFTVHLAANLKITGSGVPDATLTFAPVPVQIALA